MRSTLWPQEHRSRFFNAMKKVLLGDGFGLVKHPQGLATYAAKQEALLLLTRMDFFQKERGLQEVMPPLETGFIRYRVGGASSVRSSAWACCRTCPPAGWACQPTRGTGLPSSAHLS